MKQTPSKNTGGGFFRTLTLIISLLALTAGIYSFTANKRGKIAFVDTAKVLKAYKGIEDLGKSLEDRNKQFKNRLDTLVQEFQGALARFEKKRSSLSAKEIQDEEMKLRRMQEEYSRFNSGNQEALKQEELKLIQKAVERINDKVNRYAKSKGFAAVLGATPNGTIMYMGDYLDITDEIVAIVND